MDAGIALRIAKALEDIARALESMIGTVDTGDADYSALQVRVSRG